MFDLTERPGVAYSDFFCSDLSTLAEVIVICFFVNRQVQD